jgi:vacuolar-type H+-ATPase subunit C/Vma6
LANLLTLFRFLHMPAEQRLIKEYLDKSGFAALFVGPGSISIERLFRVYSTKNLKSAVAMLMDTPYAEALTTGTKAYNQSGRLSDIEKSLRRFHFAWQARLIAKDPLGIGVVQGFLALKINEIANLRRLARGIQLKIGTEALRAELEWLP